MNLSESFAVSEAHFFDDDDDDFESYPVDLPENRRKWEVDLKCYVCSLRFNTGVAHSKKLFCLFCYRGVCQKCLVFNFDHPETLKKEKMCKTCRVERKKLAFIFGKIEEFKLEKAQVNLEAEIAANERLEFANQRKKVQDNLKLITKTHELSVIQQENDLSALQSTNHTLKLRLSSSQQSLSELNFLHNSILNKLKFSQETLSEIKKEVFEKEKQDKDLKEKINSVRQMVIALLNKHKSKESESSKVFDKVNDLKEEISDLQRKISVKNDESSVLENQINDLTSIQETNSSVIYGLNNKISIKKSICCSSDDFTEEEQDIFNNKLEDLEKYNTVIESLEKRLQLVKLRYNRSIRLIHSRIDKISLQNEIIANANYNKKNNIIKRPVKDKNSSKSCSNCLIS